VSDDARAIPDYLAFGDLGIDSVVLIDHMPKADEKLWVEPRGDFSGGMMGNAAVAVASLGVSSGVVAKIGSDDRGRLTLDGLTARGVDTRFVRIVDAPSFWTLSLTIPTGDRTLIQFPTPAFGCDWDGFDRTILAQTRWVHTVAEEGDPVGPFLRDARGAGATTSLDIEFPFVLRNEMLQALGDVDVAFLNSGAAEVLGGAQPAARHIQGRGAGTVLVTLGERGALLLDDAGTTHTVPATDVAAVDTNGAGDAFAGAYAAGILKGFDPREALELAVFVAGRSTTALGGHGPAATVSELGGLAKIAGYGWWNRL
jgi:ribokinase